METLRKRLAGLPQAEIEERLAFYNEMIDDRIEDGLTEEEAVAEVGPVEDVVNQIMSEIPLTALVREKVRPVGGRLPLDCDAVPRGGGVRLPV